MLLQTIANGLLVGGLYATASIGFSMVWGVMGVINLAHGAFIMIGAYITHWLFTSMGIDPFVTIPIAMIVLFVLGYLLQSFLINRIMKTSLLLSLILTFGIDMILINVVIMVFSNDFFSVNTGYSGMALEIGPVLLPYVRLSIFAFALILAGGFYVFLKKSRAGQAILATALDKEVARLMSINPGRIYALTFAAGAALAGAAGALASMIFPISPNMGNEFIGAVFVITVLGGIGSIEGCVIAGMLYGLIQTFASLMIGISYQNVVAFAIFLLILVLRPQGLFGKRYYGEIS